MKNLQICGSRALNLTFQIKYDYEKLEYKIAKRKAIEVLAFFDCKKDAPER